MSRQDHEPGNGDPVNVAELIDAAPMGGFQIRVIALCALVGLVDGIDIQTLAMAIPSISEEWGASPASFAPVLSATFAGILTGTMLIAPAGDHRGRRSLILSAFMLLAAASITTAFSTSIAMLAILRFITGAAIGACLPNVTALTAEYVPAGRVGMAVTLMYAAVPLGGVLASMAGGPLIVAIGWQGIFMVGGLIPLLLWFAVFAGLPESIYVHAARGGRTAEIAIMLHRLDARFDPSGSYQFTAHDHARSSRVVDLFRNGYAKASAWLWATFFLNMAATYWLVSWLPTIFAAAGWAQGEAIRTLGYFQIGGIVGGIGGGWLADRISPHRILKIGYTLGAAGVAATAWAGGANPVLISFLLGISGIGIMGCQLVLTVVAAMLYPVAFRATGVGWALGIGRLGAVLSPLTGGMAITMGLNGLTMLYGVAGTCLLCVVAAQSLARSTSGLKATTAVTAEPAQADNMDRADRSL